MNIDIAMTIKVLLAFIGIGLILTVVMAVRAIRVGRHLEFFKKRQDLVTQGWRLIFLAVLLGGFGFALAKFGEPVAYRYFPPSPTVTRTPTVTLTPTITLTPKDTYTPTITLTLAETYTPSLPTEAIATIQTPIGPDSAAVFSPVTFSTTVVDGVVTDPVDSFDAGVTHIFGGFSYDKMVTGVQWTAVWLYEGQVIFLETKPWNYVSGGYGYTDFQQSAAQWLPGEYEVQIFVGSTWKASGRFTVVGSAAAEPGTAATTPPPGTLIVPPTPSPSPSPTQAPQ